MHKSLCALTFSVGCVVVALVGERAFADDVFRLSPTLKIGECRRYDIVETWLRETKDKTYRNRRQTEVAIEIVQRNRQGFVVAWTFGEVRLDDPTDSKLAFGPNMFGLFKYVPLEMEFDLDGNAQGIRNWSEVQRDAAKRFPIAVNELRGAGYEKNIVDDVTRALIELLKDKQYVTKAVGNRFKTFFLGFGKELRKNEPLELAGVFEVPHVHQLVPSRERFELYDLDPQRGHAKVKWTQSVRPEDIHHALNNFHPIMSKLFLMEDAPPAFNADKATTVEGSADLVFELPSGWIRTLTRKEVRKGVDFFDEGTLTYTRNHRSGPFFQ